MGIGPFNIERPLTSGDGGMLGLRRPLVGAANGVTYTVTSDSVKQLALKEDAPEAVEHVRDELEWVEEEIRNKRARIEDINESTFGEVIDTYRGELADRETLFDYRERLAEELYRLEKERDELRNQLQEIEANPEDYMDEVEAGDTVKHVLSDMLQGEGISKGPFVEYKGDRYDITLTMVGMDDRDVEHLENRIENIGLRVTSRAFFQT